MRRLSMLRSIQAFEAAARHGNFGKAAEELGVTPAAVGQHVRALESWTGTKLFKRQGSGSNRLTLTERGAVALVDFKAGLDRVAMGLEGLRTNDPSRPLVVTASHSFVSCWLLPRLPSFSARHPEIELRLEVNDGLVDIEGGDADVGLRFGGGTWDGLVAQKLMEEEVFPVCSPAWAKRFEEVQLEEVFSSSVLIQDKSIPHLKIFPTWEEWLAKIGARPGPSEKRLEINSSATVIQAAVGSQGIALARRAFVESELSTGRLVRLAGNVTWALGWSYYVVHRPEDALREAVRAFVSWAEEAARRGI
ncbi:LysR family transcriptional regulator [Panacagrimonas perspica]|uniref:LysR family transcriptional regulator n=1 Tax=Panacagrimonas perspica TaxID=381431 RepID=A0A4S3K2C0_9GAMM|nr:LysR substrate-binding domain-containing protein [Panacagrimonas perspica]TDU26500.1 LysR family transcriptional regulator [Panacagrimonas perspica]THD02112.1 hypothetical protein B1810_16700 [Panacagrimonas perspica]